MADKGFAERMKAAREAKKQAKAAAPAAADKTVHSVTHGREQRDGSRRSEHTLAEEG